MTYYSRKQVSENVGGKRTQNKKCVGNALVNTMVIRRTLPLTAMLLSAAAV